jgi:hypothetical protein
MNKQDQLFVIAMNNRLYRISHAVAPPFFDAQVGLLTNWVAVD